MTVKEYHRNGMTVHVVTDAEVDAIIHTSQPEGLFLCPEDDGSYTAIDNVRGVPWTEGFMTREAALIWLFCTDEDIDVDTVDTMLSEIEAVEGSE